MQTARRDWYAACDAAGVERVRVEWLRHSGAPLAYAATKDMKPLRPTRHTSTRMMDQVYVQLYEEESRYVADASTNSPRGHFGSPTPDAVLSSAGRSGAEGDTLGTGAYFRRSGMVVPTGFEPVSSP